MAAGSAQITIGTTATLLTQSESDGVAGSAVVLKNTGSATVYLGGPGVTTSSGYPFAAGEILGMSLMNEQVYALVASGTGTVGLFALGV